MNEKVAHIETRESRRNGIARIGLIGTDIYNTRILTNFGTRENKVEWEVGIGMMQDTKQTIDSDSKRTGINRKFDSILLGISSAVCFGLLAGVVVDLWAIPIGIIAGFYIAYKTNQQEQY
ncbi:MAG: hypothetical protein AB7I96_11175 [Candidatus Dadabacteria bacterium]